MIHLVPWELNAIYLQRLTGTGKRFFKWGCLLGIGHLYLLIQWSIYLRIPRLRLKFLKGRCAILMIRQLPYNPKRKNSEVIGYFEEAFLLKQQQNPASSFATIIFNLQAFDLSAWKLVWNCLVKKLRTFQEHEKRILHRKRAKNAVQDSLFCVRDSQVFGCVSPWTHYYQFLNGSLLIHLNEIQNPTILQLQNC